MWRNKIFWFLLPVPIMLGYNNCTEMIANTAAMDSFSEAMTSGSYSYYAVSPGCDREEAEAAMVLAIDGEKENAFIVKNSCSEQSEDFADLSKVQGHDFNPYIRYYQGKIFVNSYLYTSIDQAFHYEEYCFNEEARLAFTIQYFLYTEEAVGVTIVGSEASTQPATQFHGGFLDVFSDGTKHFTSTKGHYEIEINPATPEGTKTALYKYPDKDDVPMQCWYHM